MQMERALSGKFTMAGALGLLTLAACAPQVDSLAQSVPAQPDLATPAEWASACTDWDDWDKPGPPFRVHDDTYYVGTCGISAIFIAGEDSHVLIDSGTEAGAEIVLANIRTLGFDPADIDMILQSHEHWDHTGGLARISAVAGRGIVAGRHAWQVYATGQPDPRDPQFGSLEPMEPVEVRSTVTDGMRVGVGYNRWFTAIETPGHTPGALTWQWESCDDAGECVTIVYADSLSAISSDDYRFSDHPDYVEAFRDGLARLMELDCDILLTPHPSSSGMRDKLLAGDLTSGMNCAEYAELMDTRLSRRLAEEAGAAQ